MPIQPDRLSQDLAFGNAGTGVIPNGAAPLPRAEANTGMDMLAWLNKKRALRRTARELYGSIVTQARNPALYAAWGVPDTAQGRFEMIVLHLVLVQRRLAAEGAGGQELAQALSEAFVLDMDDSMRELTFGDLAVPREIKRATAALFDRHRAYLAALEQPHDMMLREALSTQMAYLDATEALQASSLAAYLRNSARALAAQRGEAILRGQLAWPAPDRGNEAATGRGGER